MGISIHSIVHGRAYKRPNHAPPLKQLCEINCANVEPLEWTVPS